MTADESRSAAARAARPVYILKVTLADLSPPIWRKLRVRGDTPLSGLHRILQAAMPWSDSHLHQFRVGNTYYGSPDDEFARDTLSERATTLREIAPAARDRFVYEYDFGDGWQHEIVVEEILPPDPTVRFTECVGGARACPPEDCGGVPGYPRLVEVMRNPAHPERGEMLEWIGGAFDPEAFDLNGINRALRRLASLWVMT
ncbi:MAG: plasmid pRiA4b ORF-3 family protein [bacterium]